MVEKIFGALARLYVAYPLHENAVVTLEKPQAHYLASVLRLKAGGEILLFNGQDGEWRGRLIAIDRKSATVGHLQQTRPQAEEPDIHLYFAPIKFGRIDFLVQKVTELGASLIQPVRTERTIVTRLNEERLAANAREAAEQSERLTLPDVQPYKNLTQALKDLPQERTLLYGDEMGRGQVPARLLPEVQGRKLAILIGPEGGFSPAEFQQLQEHPQSKALSLGPRILRADTAALAALTAAMIFCGDWQG
jgi:16S rRNA (uracil1498-N3)-methyltransferase